MAHSSSCNRRLESRTGGPDDAACVPTPRVELCPPLHDGCPLLARATLLVTELWNRQLHRMQTATANIDVWHQMGQRGGTGGHTSRRGGIERDRGQVVQQWWHKTASSTRLCTACRRLQNREVRGYCLWGGVQVPPKRGRPAHAAKACRMYCSAQTAVFSHMPILNVRAEE